MSREYNLLFGVFCVQLGKITPAQLVLGSKVLGLGEDVSLADHLVESKSISLSGRELIDRLVNEAVLAHDGDEGATLATFGGEEKARETFSGTGAETMGRDAVLTVYEAGDMGFEKPDSVGVVDEVADRYTQSVEHARGGMGRILLVHDEFLLRNIALKELLPSGVSSEGETIPGDSPRPHTNRNMERFLREARITAQLEHPSIVPVYEQGRRPDGTLFYTMKFVQGRTLLRAIREAQTLEERMRLLPHYLDTCQAVAYAHSRTIIHRDIKPANIMLGQFGETVLLDWGLAKSLHEDIGELSDETNVVRENSESGQTAYGAIMGTPEYMSPEQAHGDVERVDYRSDVYSLGVVLHEILSGVVPYGGDSDRKVIRELRSSDPLPSILTIEPDVPKELAAVCEKALSKEPENRYQSVKALAEIVERYHNILQADQALRAVNRQLTETNLELTESHERERLARGQAEAARGETEEALYHASIQLAAHRLSERRLDLAKKALLEAPEALRNWEWGYLFLASEPKERISKIFEGGGELDSGDSASAWAGSEGGEVFHRDGHESYVSGIAFDAEGGRVITSSADGAARVWDAMTGRRLFEFSDGTDFVQSARFSPDGKRVVTSKTYDSTAIVWDVASGEILQLLSGHSEPVSEARFDGDGTRVVTASADMTARVWDVESGGMIAQLRGHGDAVSDVRFSADGVQLYTAGLDGTTRVWDIESQLETVCVTGPEVADIAWAQLSDDFRYVVTTFSGGTSSVWERSTGELISVLHGRARKKDFTAFSPDGTCLIGPRAVGGAGVWDVQTGEELATLGQENALLLSANFGPDGRTVATGGIDGSIHIWIPQAKTDSKEAGVLAGHSDIVYYGHFSPDGSLVVTASYDKTARVWDVATGETVAVLDGHDAELTVGEFSKDGRSIVTGSWDLTRTMWDAETYAEVVRVEGRRTNRKAAFFGGARSEYNLGLSAILGRPLSPDGRYLLTRDNGLNHEIWDSVTGALRCTLEGHTKTLTTQAFSYDSSLVLTGSMSGESIVWDAVTGEHLLNLSGHEGGITFADFDCDGLKIVTSSLDHTAMIWDTVSGEHLASLVGHGGLVKTARFSPDGACILTTSVDGSVMVWDSTTGKRVSALSGHRGGMLNGIFSPDGTRILTADPEMAKIWDLDGREYITLHSKSPLTHVSWSPDGTYILTCARNGTAKLLKA